MHARFRIPFIGKVEVCVATNGAMRFSVCGSVWGYTLFYFRREKSQMKAIVCEMCNSNNVIKQDGLYICQSCGTKYTPEDAKKLMIDISGSSVKVDETDKADRYRKLAQEAQKMGNIEKAKEYYDQLVTLCPDDWKANFFSVYYTSASCIIAHIAVAAANVSNAVKLVATKICDLPDSDKIEICNQIVTYVLLLKESLLKAAQDHQVKYGTTDSYPEFCTRKDAIYQMAKDAADLALVCGLKGRAANIYETLIPFLGKAKVAKLVESLEYGRGVKLLTPDLEEMKAMQKKDRKATTFSFILLLLGLVSTILCAVMEIEGFILYFAVGITVLFPFICLFSLLGNKKASKKIKQMEYDIAHLRD